MGGNGMRSTERKTHYRNTSNYEVSLFYMNLKVLKGNTTKFQTLIEGSIRRMQTIRTVSLSQGALSCFFSFPFLLSDAYLQNIKKELNAGLRFTVHVICERS